MCAGGRAFVRRVRYSRAHGRMCACSRISARGLPCRIVTLLVCDAAVHSARCAVSLRGSRRRIPSPASFSPAPPLPRSPVACSEHRREQPAISLSFWVRAAAHVNTCRRLPRASARTATTSSRGSTLCGRRRKHVPGGESAPSGLRRQQTRGRCYRTRRGAVVFGEVTDVPLQRSASRRTRRTRGYIGRCRSYCSRRREPLGAAVRARRRHLRRKLAAT